jgi:vacuolar-type H+-ATPase subunit I/STV1
MQLIFTEKPTPGLISWNHEEIKKEVAERVEKYKTLVYTDEQIGEAKKDVAELRKFTKALEDKRKEIKKECLAPYEEFEKQVKEIIAVVNEPIELINTQVREFDEKQKSDKAKKIIAMWESIEKPEWLQLLQIERPEWLNKTYALKRIGEDIADTLTKISEDEKTLAKVENGGEAFEYYKESLNLAEAIRRAEEAQAVRIAAEEHRKAQEAAKTAQAEKVTDTEDGLPGTVRERAVFTFEVTANNTQYADLNRFFAQLSQIAENVRMVGKRDL